MSNRIVQTNEVVLRKSDFKRFLLESDKPRSNKARSYLRAIDLICEMIAHAPVGFENIQNLWSVTSSDQLESLYLFLLQESHNENSVWVIDGIAISYLRDGFCSAAIKQYHHFLIEHEFEISLVNSYSEKSELTAIEVDSLEANHALPNYLVDDLSIPEGKEKLQLVKQRTNQSVFRSMIQKNYRGRCCITGLNISAVNRASHIIGWAKDKSKRLDPSNGLFLSATYDAAFDRSLISLDDDYRIILSNDLKEFHSQESFKQYFQSVEGQKIELPLQNVPSEQYLEIHRNDGSFG